MTRIVVDARMIKSSGIGTIIANVVPRLMARQPRWDFQLLGDPVTLGAFDWTANARITPFTAPIYSIAEQKAFPVAATRGGDVLWSPNYNIPLRWRGRLLVNINDLAHLVLPEFRRSVPKQLFARFMFNAVRRRADVIAYISQFSADEFHRLVGAPRGREAVIHCGVDEAWFDVARKAAPARPYLLYVGNVKPHKNLARLLDAFARIQGEIPHDLMIVGRKEGFITGDNAVLDRIESFGGRVAFTGYVSDPVLKQIVADADGLALPSLYEGFGLPPVEAMAVGCPALVSRAASLPEVCQDAALYCDPLDVADIAARLKQLVEDEPLRQTLRERGAIRARALNWEACAAGYQKAIQDLLD
jgi:glycosyltransferase involved in cell wall biosynthesis